jgi:hypothetical protein
VLGDPIHRIQTGSRGQGFVGDGRSQRESSKEAEYGKKLGSGSSTPVVVAIAAIVGLALADGYFLSNNQSNGQAGRESSSPTAASVETVTQTSTSRPDRGSPEWVAALESAVHQMVNFERQRNLLSVLEYDSELADIARAHSKDMALDNFFEHENLSGQNAADRGNTAGIRC